MNCSLAFAVVVCWGFEKFSANCVYRINGFISLILPGGVITPLLESNSCQIVYQRPRLEAASQLQDQLQPSIKPLKLSFFLVKYSFFFFLF